MQTRAIIFLNCQGLEHNLAQVLTVAAEAK